MKIEGIIMVENEAKRFPEFETIDEMVKFFDNEDLGDYLDHMPAVDFTEIAKSRHISSEELVNTWVREKVLEAATVDGL